MWEIVKYCIDSREERNIMRVTKCRMADWIGHILRRNWLLKQITEGNTEGTKGREQRRKQLLDELKERIKYLNFKKERLDRNVWRTGFGRAMDLS
jgi:hypothetical protein